MKADVSKQVEVKTDAVLQILKIISENTNAKFNLNMTAPMQVTRTTKTKANVNAEVHVQVARTINVEMN